MKTISAKLYPNKTQEQTLLRFLRVSCWVYNKALEQRVKAWSRRRQSVSYCDQSALLTAWRSRIAFVGRVPLQVERDALRRVDRGMKAFFRRCKAGQKPGFPRFKSAKGWSSFEVLESRSFVRGKKVYITGVGPIPLSRIG